MNGKTLVTGNSFEQKEVQMDSLEKTKPTAKAVGLSPHFLYRNADKIPAAHRAGRALRWDIAALKEWMRKQAAKKANP